MSEPAALYLAGRAILRIEGADAEHFLQGLISNDIEKLSDDRAIYAALLTPQGKYLFDFLLYRDGGRIFLDTEAERAGPLALRLAMYRLRARVAIEPADDLEVASIFGAGAAEALGLEPRAGAARVATDHIAAVDPRHAELGVRLVGRREALARVIDAAGFARADFAAYDRLRIRLAVPDGSRDLVEQKSILLESNFEQINGVDFNKGCFVGQELTARTKHRGLIRKRLMPVGIDGSAAAAGTPILGGGTEMGEMRSHCDDIGLALMRLNRIEESGPVEMTAGDARIRLLDR